jgi:hypothetical protein
MAQRGGSRDAGRAACLANPEPNPEANRAAAAAELSTVPYTCCNTHRSSMLSVRKTMVQKPKAEERGTFASSEFKTRGKRRGLGCKTSHSTAGQEPMGYGTYGVVDIESVILSSTSRLAILVTSAQGLLCLIIPVESTFTEDADHHLRSEMINDHTTDP